MEGRGLWDLLFALVGLPPTKIGGMSGQDKPLTPPLLLAGRQQRQQELKSGGDFYAYEKRFAEIWIELGRAVLESSVSEVPADRRKKRSFERGLDKSK